MDLNSSQDRNYGEHFKNMIFTSLSYVHSNLEPTKQVYNSAGSDYGRIRKLEKGSVAQVRAELLKGEQEHSRLPGQYRLQVWEKVSGLGNMRHFQATWQSSPLLQSSISPASEISSSVYPFICIFFVFFFPNHIFKMSSIYLGSVSQQSMEYPLRDPRG